MRYVAPFGVTDPDSSYINGNPAAGLQGSIPPAEAFESPLRELSNLISKAGLEPTVADLLQVTKAVRRQSLNYCVDTGAANALVAVYDPVFTGLTPGLPLRIKAAHDNTGPSTILVDGVGPVPIKRANGAALDAGDISAGEVVDLVFDGTNFQLTNFRGFTAEIENTNNFYVNIPYAADTNASVNAITATFSPAITELAAGDLLSVKINGTNTDDVTITVNALPSKQVKSGDGYQLEAGQIVDGMIAYLVYDGTVFQLVNPAAMRTGAGTGIQIAKRFVWQDPNYHATTTGEGVPVEAFRVTYTPVAVGNKLFITMNGIGGSGSGAQGAGKRNWSMHMSYSTDNGATWNPPSRPGDDYPTVGSFMANAAMSVWENASAICSQREETFLMSGEMTVPAGPPANIIFRMQYCVRAANCPDALIHGGSIVHIVEYTPGT